MNQRRDLLKESNQSSKEESVAQEGSSQEEIWETFS